MSVRLRRGTNAQRLTITPLSGELIYTTDTKEVFVGDDTTVGGKAVTAFTNQQAESVLKTAFSTSDLIVNNTHSGIGFTYNSVTNRLTAVVTTPGFSNISVQGQENIAANTPGDTLTLVSGNNIVLTSNSISNTITVDSLALTTVSQDTAPTLGGVLNLNSHSIVGQGSINISGAISSNAAVLSDTIGSDSTVNRAGISIRTNDSIGSASDLLTIDSAIDYTQGRSVKLSRTRGTLDFPQPLEPQDALTGIHWSSINGDLTEYKVAAGIEVYASSAPTAEAVPGRLELKVSNLLGNLVSGLTIHSDSVIEIQDNQLSAGTNTGEVNLSGTVKYIKILVNGVEYAMSLYPIN